MSDRFPLLADFAVVVLHEDIDESTYALDDMVDHAASLPPEMNLQLSAECRSVALLRGEALWAALDEIHWVWRAATPTETAEMFGHFADLFEGVAEELSAA